jgi:hypothetical protein
VSASVPASAFALILSIGQLAASMSLEDRLSERHEALLEDRREAFPSLSDPFGVPQAAKVVLENDNEIYRRAAAWRGNVVATIFWVGEQPTENNPTPNDVSAWDPNWESNFGGYDDPKRRDGFLPAGFVPRLNPFYVALPYNDIGSDWRHKPEASEVIPWFWRDYRGDGVSVCKGRWIAIHLDGRVCYAQWEDVGPFDTDHWQYVFRGAEPRDNRNGGAGIDLSPAVRDYLQLKSGERVQWRFVESHDVPPGPWKDWRP